MLATSANAWLVSKVSSKGLLRGKEVNKHVTRDLQESMLCLD